MSIIKCNCPYCGQILEAEDSSAGQKAQCWKCQGKFFLPSAPVASKPAQKPQIKPAPAKGFPIMPLVVVLLIVAGIAVTMLRDTTDHSPKETINSPKQDTPTKKRHKSTTANTQNKVVANHNPEETTVLTTAGGSDDIPEERNSTDLSDQEQATHPKTQDKKTLRGHLKVAGFSTSNEMRKYFASKVATTLSQNSTTSALNKQSFKNNLMRHEILLACAGDELNQLYKQDQFKPFLKVFLNDPIWMNKFLTSGPMPAPSRALNYLYIIWKYDKECTKPLYQTIATALALEKSEHDYKGEKQNYQTFRRYQNYKQAHKDLKLHGSFEKLKTWEMRFALEIDFGDQHFNFMLNDRNYMTSQYGGACWSCAYLLRNSFNDSVFGRDYYKPWEWTYSWAEKTRYVGGVCGSLSYHGSRMARVHGILSMTAGEPGHCAYCIRQSDGKWKLSYHVAWPSSPHNTFWGGKYTYFPLIERAFKNSRNVTKAHQYVWLAHFYKSKVEVTPIEAKLYKGRWRGIPDFSTMTPVEVKKTNQLDYHKDFTVKNWFGLSYTGYIQVPTTQEYLIQLKGDDFVNLYIDDKLITKVIRSKASKLPMKLTAGRHKFKIDFCEGAGRDYFSLQIDPIQRNTKVLKSYRRAVESSPQQYGIWQEYRQQLLTKSSPEQRVNFCKLAAKHLIQHQEAAWNLINTPKMFKGASTSEKLKLILNLHKILAQSAINDYINWPMNKVLDRQARFLGKDEEAIFKMFTKLLTIHADSNDYFMWVFNWGSERWSKAPKFKNKLNYIITKLLKGHSKLSHGTVEDLLKSAIVEASKIGNRNTFQKYSRIAQKVLKLAPPKTAPRHFPEIKPFKGTLISASGLLQLSSISRWDNPFHYLAVLSSPTGGGKFQTNKEEHPYAKVKLRGKCKLSGIIIVNSKSNKQRAVPLKVSISTNGKTWKTVFTTTVVKDVWHINLGRKNLKAKYIRAEGIYKEGRKDFFHLQSILVYGKKLY